MFYPGFTSEAQLVSHLKSSYEKTVAESESSVLTGVQQLVSAVKTFFTAKSDVQVRQQTVSKRLLLDTLMEESTML